MWGERGVKEEECIVAGEKECRGREERSVGKKERGVWRKELAEGEGEVTWSVLGEEGKRM